VVLLAIGRVHPSLDGLISELELELIPGKKYKNKGKPFEQQAKSICYG